MNGQEPIDLGDIPGKILELAGGEPELVVVDARVLQLIMGDLSRLIILQRVPVGGGFKAIPGGEEPYVWDSDPLCER